MKKSAFLSLLTLAAAAVVLLTFAVALRGIASTNAAAAELQMMQTLLPNSTTFAPEPYTGEDEAIRAVHKADNGFVIETVTNGYVDDIVLMVGVDNTGSVTGVVVKEMHETFGLGTRALGDWQFLAQLLNTNGNAEIGSNVDALSGATVTSKAIVRGVNAAVAVVTGADAESSASVWEG